MKNLRLIWLAILCSLMSLPATVSADVTLPSVFGSHMVLQRDMPIPVWGWADPGEEIKVTLGDNEKTTKADGKGNWKVEFPALKATSKGRTLTVAGNNRVELSDILIGEVWVGSGQSNMEWPMSRTQNAKEAIAAASHPNIRLFHVPKVQTKAPAKDVKAAWRVCTPKTVPSFSGVLYYFGLKLHKDLDIPVGLINSSWGGSPIEPWTVKGKNSGGMYNGMIAPLQPFAVRGVVWYQGETNVMQKNGFKYYDKMKDLIYGWRKSWGEDFPFYFVQIAPWAGRYEKGELPKLWEAQVASLKIPKTGMAVTTDIVDNIRDIHPQNKHDVGYRLARWALAKTYGKKIVYSGPLYKGMKREGDKIRLSFAHTGKGLKTRDGKEPNEFQIAGKDGKFVPAQAKIEDDTVVVSADGVSSPTQVRFGWHKLANPNLVNSEGLPASPFQTKNWRGGTGE